jgi:hypothetical protein
MKNKMFLKKKKNITIDLLILKEMIINIRQKNLENAERSDEYENDPEKALICLKCYNHVYPDIIEMTNYIESLFKTVTNKDESEK